jgi:hypothetical protein
LVLTPSGPLSGACTRFNRAFAEINFFAAAGADMGSVKLIGKDFLFLSAVGTLTVKGL